jgi:hypothetical protein
VCLEKRLLNDAGKIDLPLQPAVNLQTGQQDQVLSITFQVFALARYVAHEVTCRNKRKAGGSEARDARLS